MANSQNHQVSSFTTAARPLQAPFSYLPPTTSSPWSPQIPPVQPRPLPSSVQPAQPLNPSTPPYPLPSYTPPDRSFMSQYHVPQNYLYRPRANIALQGRSTSKPNWILDFGSSHHVTSNLHNFTTHSPYNGTTGLVVSDGSPLPISHTDR